MNTFCDLSEGKLSYFNTIFPFVFFFFFFKVIIGWILNESQCSMWIPSKALNYLCFLKKAKRKDWLTELPRDGWISTKSLSPRRLPNSSWSMLETSPKMFKSDGMNYTRKINIWKYKFNLFISKRKSFLPMEKGMNGLKGIILCT